MSSPAITEPVTRSLLGAIGGKFGWRYWWPVLVWLVVLALFLIFQEPGQGGPAASLKLASFVAALLLWVLGAKAALNQGHDKAAVFTATLLAVGVVAFYCVAIGTATRMIEVMVFGPNGQFIFAARSGKYYSPEEVFNWAESLYLIFGVPILLIIMLLSCWSLRRGLAGFVESAAIALLGGVSCYLLTLGLQALGFDAPVALLTQGVVALVAGVALAWYGFTRDAFN